jgi:hypothetical protein
MDIYQTQAIGLTEQTPFYQIDVSGKIYKISQKLLLTIPYFANMIKDIGDNENKYIFVERSSLLFDHVYAYVIDKLHPYPIEYYYELDFYGIEYEKDKLFDMDKSVNNKFIQLENRLIKVENININVFDGIGNLNRNEYTCYAKKCKNVANK